mgnify:CR=1 FL=1
MESTAPNRRQQIAALLKRYWGFDTFRPVQEQVILSVLAGRDTLALMPTGGGKSLTYQIPGLASEGVCIVVTPLIALMKDQVDRLRKLGIRALAIHSGLSARQIDIDLDNCVYGDVKFLYVAPERLASEAFRLRVQRMNVSLLAVDEAHLGGGAGTVKGDIGNAGGNRCAKHRGQLRTALRIYRHYHVVDRHVVAVILRE